MPICKNCGEKFPNKISVKGKIRNLSGRKFCTSCSSLDGRNTKSYIIKLKENEAFCIRCQEVKDKTCFYIRKSSGKPFSYCIKCQNDVKKLKFEEKMESIIQLHGGICADCGISFPAPVYEFYLNNVVLSTSMIKNMSLKRLIKKLEGCVMLCKNCCAMREWAKN